MGKGTAVRMILNEDGSDLSRRRSLVLGFVISVIGSSAFGVLNLMVIQISVERNWQSALWFSFGCVLVETTFVRYSVVFTKWISRNPKTKKVFDWGALALFLILSIACFCYNSATSLEMEITIYAIPAFFLGVGMRLFYPSMIPYWLGWNAALISQEVVFKPIPFAIAAGIGTFIMHAGYIYAGQLALDYLKDKGDYIMFVLGVLLLVTSSLHAKRMFFNKVS
jgi:threonine/homoserine/homoserine lactone efflux protein